MDPSTFNGVTPTCIGKIHRCIVLFKAQKVLFEFLKEAPPFATVRLQETEPEWLDALSFAFGSSRWR